MRIALITDGIQPYVTGGMQKHSFYIAKTLAMNSIAVDLYHTWQNKEHDIEKLEVFTADEKKFICSFTIPFPQRGYLPGHYLRRSYKYSCAIYELFKTMPEVDFVYVKGFAGWKLIEEKAKGVKLPPVGIKFHGLNMFQKPPSLKGWLQYCMMRPAVLFNMLNADYVFSYGGKITQITRSVGVDAEKIIEIPAGVDASWLSGKVENQRIRTFLFIGRIERLKGIRELNAAINKVKDSREFEFHFIGPFPEKSKINSHKVKYWGKITDTARIREVIKKCDVLVCPSYSEGMPNVILEAMAQSLAVIATDVGAVNLLVSKDTGWLIDRSDVNLIASALTAAIECTGDELARRKTNAFQRVKENFLWEKTGGDLIAALKKIAG